MRASTTLRRLPAPCRGLECMHMHAHACTTASPRKCFFSLGPCRSENRRRSENRKGEALEKQNLSHHEAFPAATRLSLVWIVEDEPRLHLFVHKVDLSADQEHHCVCSHANLDASHLHNLVFSPVL